MLPLVWIVLPVAVVAVIVVAVAAYCKKKRK